MLKRYGPLLLLVAAVIAVFASGAGRYLSLDALKTNEAVLRGFVHHLTSCSAGCIYSNNFLGLLRFFPTSGGSSPSPDGFLNAADINADIAITLTADAASDQLTIHVRCLREHAARRGTASPRPHPANAHAGR